jgi:hypothetical protein
MTQGLARYHARSPRYTLNTEDDSLIRVAGPRQIPWEEGTDIRNVSLTGLAFTAPSDLCPMLGEVIRIQFSVPGGKQMACHSIVTRIDQQREGTMLVAVHFYRMEMAHRIMLAQGLSKRFRDHTNEDGSDKMDEIGAWTKLPAATMLFISLWLWTSMMLALMIWGQDGVLNTIRLLLMK